MSYYPGVYWHHWFIFGFHIKWPTKGSWEFVKPSITRYP